MADASLARRIARLQEATLLLLLKRKGIAAYSEEVRVALQGRSASQAIQYLRVLLARGQAVTSVASQTPENEERNAPEKSVLPGVIYAAKSGWRWLWR